MDQTEVSSVGFWTAVGVALTAAVGAVVKFSRGLRRDRRDDFESFVKTLRAEVGRLELRVNKLEQDHANCQQENFKLMLQNARQQTEIDALKADLAKLAPPPSGGV